MNSKHALLAGMAALVLAGCGGVQPADGAKAVAAARDEAHRSPGKPRPPVQVSLAPGRILQSGVPGTLALQVRAPDGIEVRGLTIQGDDGLSVLGLQRAAAGIQAGDYELDVTPISGGARQLTGLVSFTVNGVEQAAPFRLAVKVEGPQTLPSLSPLPVQAGSAVDATGEIIYSMKAETTVR